MSTPRVARFLGVTAVTIRSLQGAFVPSAVAQPCPDVQVLFARGTGEATGVGPTGRAFIDSLRSRVGGKSLDVYPVDYPASREPIHRSRQHQRRRHPCQIDGGKLCVCTARE